MDERRRKEAIEYIMGQLNDGYIDLGLHDKDELEIVKKAMTDLILLEEWVEWKYSLFNLFVKME